jgi:GR25 family glycosyltransferase involved in LPS biosynthesis
MKIYVINVKDQINRRKHIENQLISLGIINYEIIEAVEDKDIDINEMYNQRLAKRYYRELSKVEIAISKSHLKCYKKILDSKERGIILEDDSVLSRNFLNINYLNDLEDIGILFLGYFTSNIRNIHSKPLAYVSDLYSEVPTEIGDISRCYFENNSKGDFYKIDKQSYAVDYLVGAHAYSPSLKVCNILLKLQKKVILPADMVWNHFYRFGIKETLYAPLYPWVVQSIVSNIISESTVRLEREIILEKHRTDHGIIKRISNPQFGT